MLHKETLINVVKYFKWENFQKQYIKDQLRKIDSEFLSEWVFNAIIEDAALTKMAIYDLSWNLVDFVLYQHSTNKLLTYWWKFEEFKIEGYKTKVLQNANIVLLIPNNIKNGRY